MAEAECMIVDDNDVFDDQIVPDQESFLPPSEIVPANTWTVLNEVTNSL